MYRTLTIIDWKELPEGWEADFPFEAISVKPLRRNVMRVWVDQVAEVKRRVPPSVDVHIWEWFPCTTPAEGKRFGEKMGRLCTQHGVMRFYVNAEAQWSGVEGYPRTREPYATLFEFCVQFYLFAPEGCELWFNGFSWSATSDGRKLYDAELLRCMAGRCVMIHGTDRASLERSGRRKLALWPGVRVMPQFGVGRVAVDPRTKETSIWGFWAVHKKLLSERPDIEDVSWFFGNGAGPQYFGGHGAHPALVKCARELET